MAPKHHSSASTSPLASLFRRLAPRLLGSGKRLLGSEEEASDAMQDTFVKLWSKGGEFSDALVITAMRNTCIDALRQRRETINIEETALADPTGDGASASEELYDEVNRLIGATLSERDRRIMLMRDRDGYELDAIASRTGLTEANIRVILSRARRAVRDAYRTRSQASDPMSNKKRPTQL